MSDFTWTPEWDFGTDTRTNVLETKFGDGYGQASPDGINNIVKDLPLVFKHRDDTEADAIEAFLEGKEGSTPFTFTIPGGSESTYRCRQWKRTRVYSNNNTITAKFEEYFGS